MVINNRRSDQFAQVSEAAVRHCSTLSERTACCTALYLQVLRGFQSRQRQDWDDPKGTGKNLMGTMLASLRNLLSGLDTCYSCVLEGNSFSYSAVFTNVLTLISRPLRTLLLSLQETRSPVPRARKVNLDS